MKLPEQVLLLMDALERAGFSVYAVGGCVRDALLGLTPHDYDLCTDATPGQMHRVFAGLPLVTDGEKHGTVGVILEHRMYEITTFRTEGNYSDSRHPDRVEFVRDICQDLARRDFTVNAMAYHPKEGYIDPFGGREDLTKRVLRCVGDPQKRFTEDALRILRGVRFAARFDLTPDSATEEAMTTLAPLLDKLARERVFDELCKLLLWANAPLLLRFAPVLLQAVPALKPCFGFHQHTVHHAYDVYTHTAHVMAAVPAELPLRWAALLHDIGKPATFTLDDRGCGHFYGHAQVGAEMADEVLLQLKAPTALRQQVCLLIRAHMQPLEPDRKQLRRVLSKWGMDTVLQLKALQQADFTCTGVTGDHADFAAVTQLLEELKKENACLHIRDLAIDGSGLQRLGFTPGPRLGACLNYLLEQVLEETLPNTPEALAEEAMKFLTREGSL